MYKDEQNKTIVVLSSHTPSLFWFRMDMMKSFLKLGYSVVAVGNEKYDKWEKEFKKENIEYRQIYVKRNGTNPLEDFKTYNSIKKVLKEIHPYKIFAYQAKTVIYGGLAANSLGITEVYPLIAGVGSVFLKNDLKSKLIKKIMVTEYKLSMKKSPKVFFQNKDDEKIFFDNKIVKKGKTVMIPGSGVNLQNFKFQTMPNEFGFLCISRLIKDKGIYEYLEACKKIKKLYPEVRCLLVGPYDTNPSAITPNELQEYINIGVEYFGEQRDVKPYLEQCNVFVLPSYREGTPKANLEAMASGKAIITTDATGCRETVVDKVNGFLVPIKNVEAIVEAMKYFINNPSEAFEMGREGRKICENTFDVDIVNRIICATMKL